MSTSLFTDLYDHNEPREELRNQNHNWIVKNILNLNWIYLFDNIPTLVGIPHVVPWSCSVYSVTMEKSEWGELGYRFVHHLCDLRNCVSSELVENLANLVCPNPRWRLPSRIWIPNGRWFDAVLRGERCCESMMKQRCLIWEDIINQATSVHNTVLGHVLGGWVSCWGPRTMVRTNGTSQLPPLTPPENWQAIQNSMRLKKSLQSYHLQRSLASLPSAVAVCRLIALFFPHACPSDHSISLFLIFLCCPCSPIQMFNFPLLRIHRWEYPHWWFGGCPGETLAIIFYPCTISRISHHTLFLNARWKQR